MSTSPESAGGQPRQINLQDLVNQFMGGLQRHFDMLAFNLAARSRAQEADYDRIAKAVHIMPAAPAHRNFEQTQAYARDLLIRQVVGDAMNLAVTCLNNAHLFLALAKAHRDHPGEEETIQKEARESHEAFVRAPLDRKFDRLESEYEIRCELEDTLTSLGFVARNFMRQRSAVEAGQTDENGELVIELKAVDTTGAGDGGTAPLRPTLIEERKVFREGDTVFFTDRELQLILVTIGSFAHGLFRGVARFAKGAQGG
ncbi:MAG: hypothetical protein ACLFTU_03535 [Puniceicoccaceae bacterium]